MKTITQILSEHLLAALEQKLPGLEAKDKARAGYIQATRSKHFGDYQSNAAMILAKKFGQAPRVLAGDLAEALPEPVDEITEVEVEGAGFINFRLKPAWIAQRLLETAVHLKLGVAELSDPIRVVIDYCAPNIAKPMHVGHIRSMLIGNAVDRILRFKGFDVVSDNHVGDWGTQFGKVLYSFKNWSSLKKIEDDPLDELMRIYQEFDRKANEDPELEDRAREELVKLQQKDPENNSLWQRFIDLSMRDWEDVYHRLGVHLDHALGESFYNDMLPGVVDELIGRGYARESEGAIVIFFDNDKYPPFLIRKSDGGYLYATTDVATLGHRVKEWNPDRIIYVTDARQKLHFQQLFEVGREMLGIEADLVHIAFGMMSLPEGHFSTRQGTVIKLNILLDEAEERAFKVVSEKRAELSEEKRKDIARLVGLGAVKYNDLYQNYASAVKFDWDKILSFEGNTAPYLQYTHARVHSLFRKAGEDFSEFTEPEKFTLDDPAGLDLARHLITFPSVVDHISETYYVNHLCDFLYEAAELFNRFYTDRVRYPIVDAVDGMREPRLYLTKTFAFIMAKGLSLLGIEAPEEM